VGHTIHPSLGYVTGWSMLFDYVMNPIICVIWCSKAAANFPAPAVPGVGHLLRLFFTVLNLQGVKTSARTNAVIAGGLGLVILLFLAAAFRYLSGSPWTRRRSPALLRPGDLLLGQGVDGHQPGRPHLHRLRRDLDPLRGSEEPAPQHPCSRPWRSASSPGSWAASRSNLAQLIWPDWTSYPDVDTAFVHVAGRAGGPIVFAILNASLLVANMGSGMGAHLGASRLLYGMGRDDAIPRRFFGAVNPRTHVPSNNVILVGVIALAGAFTVSYGLGPSS